MVVAEIREDGSIHVLDALAQEVSLGKNTFTKGSIAQSTIEECVRVLRIYRRSLEEYGITDRSQVRAVATSAVREATNRLAFIDRIYSATGFKVEVIEESRVNHITYLGLQPILNSQPELQASRTIISEVGGGSTEILSVDGGEVTFSYTYRLGSLRLRRLLEAHRAPVGKIRQLMESQIQRTVRHVVERVKTDKRIEMIAIGGDVRFAASRILGDMPPDRLGVLPLADLEQFTHRVLSRTVDELVRDDQLPFADAETLGPALLAYLRLAGALELDHLYVASITLRDGLLKELALRDDWTGEFRAEIVRSAIALGRRFGFLEAHGRHVADLCARLCRELTDLHELSPRYELILYLAALLHDVGNLVSNRGHHKHSMYLINNSNLFGFGRQEVLLTALVARYHRRASPKPTHEGYATLDWESRIAVAKMAAILRVADALDRSGTQRVREIVCERDGGDLVIVTPGVQDLSSEQFALKQKGTLFEEIFGLRVILRPDQLPRS
ncbi:MAG: exopolyphosphatase [Phycisphaeraceae bacterium]|nr:exopolyphosphatase [Phycisphaeraceae bacterium]